MKNYYVYILTNKRNGTLYVGVTNDIERRIHEHKLKLADGFTKQYNINKLVYYESTPEIENALTREKLLKRWKREWKLNLIEDANPDWKDLSLEFQTWIPD